MEVKARSDWMAGLPSDLVRGDLFIAPLSQGDVLALMAEHDGSPFVLVLASRGAHPSLAPSSLPGDLSIGAIRSEVVLKFVGTAAAGPLFEREALYGPSFPKVHLEPTHGALVIDGGGGPWIHCKSLQTKPRCFVNLRTGQTGEPEGWAAYPAWRLDVEGERGEGELLARFGG